MAELAGGGSSATVGTSVDDQGAPVISLSGELDISNVQAVEAECAPLITSNKRVTFDLSELNFMDSSGIALLLRAADRTETIALRRPTATVKRIISATGLVDVFEILDD
jgi:anti-anti-sigma factor